MKGLWETLLMHMGPGKVHVPTCLTRTLHGSWSNRESAQRALPSYWDYLTQTNHGSGPSSKS